VKWLRRLFGERSRLPRDSDAVLRRALLAVLDRDFGYAEELLERAVKLDSNDPENYIALAHLYRARGELGRAIRIHQNVLLRPDLDRYTRLEALVGLGNDFREGGFLGRAIGKYIEVLEIEPDHREALKQLIPMLIDTRDIQGAIAMERRLARLGGSGKSTEEVSFLVDIALVAKEDGKLGEARRVLKRALRRDPKYARAWILLGDLEVERGRTRAAISAWKHVAQLDLRKAPTAYARLRNLWTEMNRGDTYESFLRDILSDFPGDRGATLALVEWLASKGNPEGALDELRPFLQFAAKDLEARGLFGKLLLESAKREDALKEFEALLALLQEEGLLTAREHSA